MFYLTNDVCRIYPGPSVSHSLSNTFGPNIFRNSSYLYNPLVVLSNCKHHNKLCNIQTKQNLNRYNGQFNLNFFFVSVTLNKANIY